jgi:hypothetical protein
MHRLAANIATDAKLASVRQRLRRFFEQVTLDEAAGARLLADQLGLCGKRGWDLQIDRTNWDFGETTHTVLTLSVLWNGTAIPLFWTMLDKKGNWLRLLRLASPTSFRDGQEAVQLKWLARDLAPNETLNLKGGWRIGRTERDASPPVFLVIRRLKNGDLLILAASFSAKRALATYRLRWKIETLFGLLKTKGFNLEDTHMKDPKRLSTLLSILAIADALVVKAGHAARRITPIAVKKHGRPARSVFALGLDTLRRYFVILCRATDYDFENGPTL